MSFPPIFEVVIGLMLIYYLLGAVVSMITQMVMESAGARGAILEKYLKQTVGDKAAELTDLPQIKALRPIRYANWWHAFSAGTAQKKVEIIPVDTLVDAFFDLSGLTAQGSLSAGELTSLINKLPDSDGKRALLGWIQQGVTAISDLRIRTRAYFAGVLNQAASAFKARARSLVILASIALTLLFGIDSIQLGKNLWSDAGLHSVAAQQAAASTSQPETAPDLNALIEQLGVLSSKIGWWRPENIPVSVASISWLPFALVKLAGLSITAIAVSQGSSFWYDVMRRAAGRSATPPADPSEASGAAG